MVKNVAIAAILLGFRITHSNIHNNPNNSEARSTFFLETVGLERRSKRPGGGPWGNAADMFGAVREKSEQTTQSAEERR